MNNVRLIFIFTLFFTQVSSGADITMAVKTQFHQKDRFGVILYLHERADLTASRSILDRRSRLEFVHHRLVETAQRTQGHILDYLNENRLEYRRFFSQNAVAVFDISENQILELGQFAEIRQIGLNVHASVDFQKAVGRKSMSPSSVASHLQMIKVDRVWNELNVRGEGIVLGGQDSGYYWQHDALKKKYRGYNQGAVDHNFNWHDAMASTPAGPCSAGGASPCDDKDHGTHTMGTMVGDDEKGNQIGVAPKARWLGCRNMKDGEGTVATYLECFDFFMAPYPIGGDPFEDGRPDLAPHIVNNSWACPTHEGCQGDEFFDAVNAYKAAGIMLVAAAGNEGPGCGTVSSPPATYAGDLLAVGAWNSFLKEIAYFSSRGPSSWNNQLAPNIIAPGSFVRSSLASGPNDYDDKAGTSMASPQVAGVVALLWAYKPELIGRIDATIDIIQSSASPIRAKNNCGPFSGSQVPNAVYGYGMLDAYKALTL